MYIYIYTIYVCPAMHSSESRRAIVRLSVRISVSSVNCMPALRKRQRSAAVHGTSHVEQPLEEGGSRSSTPGSKGRGSKQQHSGVGKGREATNERIWTDDDDAGDDEHLLTVAGSGRRRLSGGETAELTTPPPSRVSHPIGRGALSLQHSEKEGITPSSRRWLRLGVMAGSPSHEAPPSTVSYKTALGNATGQEESSDEEDVVLVPLLPRDRSTDSEQPHALGRHHFTSAGHCRCWSGIGRALPAAAAHSSLDVSTGKHHQEQKPSSSPHSLLPGVISATLVLAS